MANEEGTSDGRSAAPLPRAINAAFLPDDSFLHGVEERAAAPVAAKAANDAALGALAADDEWLLVDDDLAELVTAVEPVESSNVAPAAVEPVEAQPAAPIVPIARARPRLRTLWMAAAGLIVGLTLAGAIVYGLRAHSGDVTSESVALRDPTPRVAASPPPVVAPAEPVAANEETPPPAPLEQDSVVAVTPPPDAAQPVEPTASQTPLPVEPPAGPPVVVEVPPTTIAAAPPVPVPAVPAAPKELAPTAPNRPPVGVIDHEPAIHAARSQKPAPSAATTRLETIVELKNGHSFRGRIRRVKDSRMTLNIGTGECTFDLADVRVLDASAPEFRRVEEMPEASVVLQSGQRLRGRLMKQTDEQIVLVVEKGELVFPRADVKGLSFAGRVHF